MSLFIFGSLAMFAFLFVVLWVGKSNKSNRKKGIDKPVDWDNAYNRDQLTKWFEKKKIEYNDDASFIRYMSETYGEDIAIKHLVLSLLSMRSEPLDSTTAYNMAKMKAKTLHLLAVNYRDRDPDKSSIVHAQSIILATTAAM